MEITDQHHARSSYLLVEPTLNARLGGPKILFWTQKALVPAEYRNTIPRL